MLASLWIKSETYYMAEVQPLGGPQVLQQHYQILDQRCCFSDLDRVIVPGSRASLDWQIANLSRWSHPQLLWQK
jgi:hypothetical protein